MNGKEINKLIEIVREKEKIDASRDWCQGSKTYFKEIRKELTEVEVELKENNKVFLEDELGDVLWDYLNLLVQLENEDKISFENISKRALKKYSQRINGISEGRSWEDIKKEQKKELHKEQFPK